MKKTILSAFLLAAVATVARAQSIQAFVSDDDGAYTNVRNAPKGAIIDHVSAKSGVIIEAEDPQNGWWRISDGAYWDPDQNPEDGELKPSPTGHWIHASVLAVSTRNYGGEKLHLRDKPSDNGRTVFTITEETMLRPYDIHDTWVKVKTIDGKHTGWIEGEWLCGNSVTTCP